MITGVIVTHGSLAKALLDTARSIYGDFSNCYAISNAQKSPQALGDELESIVEANADSGGIVIMTDFFGGSCSHACLMVEQGHGNVRLVTGVNLPMLLAFLYRRAEVPFEELPAELVERGLSSIKELNAENL
jgi:mannose/fructose-specific phosphotransferase system component IIA